MNEPIVPTHARPLVSIIIPTKNSAEYLSKTLSSISAQTYVPIEIIVVDNFSTDATRAIAESFSAIVDKIGPERSVQLNRAIQVAKGEYIYRVDSDFVVDPGLVEECVNLCQAGADAIAVFNGSHPANGFWARVREFERKMYRNDTDIVGARFIRARLMRTIGGFDSSLVAGEDYDLHNKLLMIGARIEFSTLGELHLGEPKTLKEYVSKNFYYGTTIGRYVRRYPLRSIKQFNPVRGAYIRNNRQFASQPRLAIGFFVLLSLKYAAAACGMIVGILRLLSRQTEGERLE